MNDKENYFTYLSAVMPVFAAIGLGIWFRKKNWLSEAADSSLLRLTANALLPALILDSILQNAALKNPATVFLAPVFGFLTTAIGMGAALLCGKYFGKFLGLTTHNSLWTFVFCIGIYSYSYPPLALAKTLFGPDTTGVLLTHNLGVEISLWTLGLILLGVTGVLQGWKRLINAPFIAVVLGLLLNLINADRFLPRFVLWSIGLLAQCAIPLGLILIGATLADHLHEFRPSTAGRLMIGSCVLRLLLLPFVFLSMARFIPFPVELKQVLVLQSAMPSAIVPVVIMVRYYGGDTTTAMRVVVSTLMISLFTMPLWILFGLNFAHLRLTQM